MDYHAKNGSKYGVLQIHVDGSAFKKIAEIWPRFKDESCNLRLSLAARGVNPFGEIIYT
jgi:hypothetical protein